MARLKKKASRSSPAAEALKGEKPNDVPPGTTATDVSNDTKTESEDSCLDDPIEEGEAAPDLEAQLESLELESVPSQPPPAYTDGTFTEEPAMVDDPQASSPKSSKIKAAFGEVRHFAGGLISHPYEATKHYSIVRHGHGLVFYQGPTTSVAVTVFSDRSLPANRKLWLQKRGFSGRAGLKIGSTLGTRSAWIDVTPATDATADMLPPGDDRAWQRDIKRFMKKAEKAKSICNQNPYETDVVRIPHVAEDGYFRIVLCAGRKVLCPSPIFRYASSSLDPSHLRGASLSTVPLELAIKIGIIAARHSANAAAHGALQPALTTYQNSVQPVVQRVNPLGLTQDVAQAAYNAEAAKINKAYGKKREKLFQTVSIDVEDRAVLLGSNEGPESPFPVKFCGVVRRGSGKTRERLGTPTANLDNVPEETLLRLSGVYIGWATISRTKVSKSSSLPDDAYDVWYQAVITVCPIREEKAKIVAKKSVNVYLINDFNDAVFYEARLNVMVMALLRPVNVVDNVDVEKEQLEVLTDIATARGSLDREAWSAETMLQRIRSDSSNRSFTERLADARSLGQRQIDKVPLHRLGLKTDSMGLKDRLIGNGGICIKR